MTDSYRKIQAVVIRERNKGEILLVHYVPPNSYWETITGNINEHETMEEGLERELLEEIALRKNQIIKKSHLSSFEFEKNGRHYVEDIFLVEVNDEFIPDISHNPDEEHNGYGWFSPDKAMALVPWQNMKEAIEEALKKA